MCFKNRPKHIVVLFIFGISEPMCAFTLHLKILGSLPKLKISGFVGPLKREFCIRIVFQHQFPSESARCTIIREDFLF